MHAIAGEALASALVEPAATSMPARLDTTGGEVFDMLDALIAGEPRVVLDIGAGDGALARPLADRVDRVDRVDAVEISQATPHRSGSGNPPGPTSNSSTPPHRWRGS